MSDDCVARLAGPVLDFCGDAVERGVERALDHSAVAVKGDVTGNAGDLHRLSLRVGRSGVSHGFPLLSNRQGGFTGSGASEYRVARAIAHDNRCLVMQVRALLSAFNRLGR